VEEVTVPGNLAAMQQAAGDVIAASVAATPPPGVTVASRQNASTAAGSFGS